MGAERDRESEGDYMAYLWLDRNTFADLVHRVAPRITKSERYVFISGTNISLLYFLINLYKYATLYNFIMKKTLI